MILIKLSEILGRKKLKLSDVISKTGLTRPTLTTLYYGTGKGINFDTLNKLCKFLSVTPGDLMHYYNADIACISINFDTNFTIGDEVINEDADTVEVISSAYFTGLVKFETPITELKFVGWLSGHKDHVYDVVIKIQLTRKDYFNLLPEDVLDYLDEKILEAIAEEFSQFDNDVSFSDVMHFYLDDKTNAADQGGNDSPAE